MRKINKKLTALLLAIGCTAACAGVGASLATPTADGVTAVAEETKEYTTHKLGKLVLHANSKSFGAAKEWNDSLFLIRADEQALPFEGWQNPFVLESGAGLKVNGEAATLLEMQSADGAVYLKFEGRNVGDIVTIGGTFVCENQGIKYEIEECSFKWLGLGWEACANPIQYTTYELGKLAVHVHSIEGVGKDWKNAVYLKRVDGQGFAFSAWQNPFKYESGLGFKINGEEATLNEMQSADDALYLNFAELNAGDIITIGGTYACESQAVKYVIEESYIQWTGEAWVEYVPPVQYTTYEVGKLVYNTTIEGKGIHLDRADGKAFEKADSSWAEKLTFLEGSGVGVTLNGEPIPMNDIKIPGNIYLGMEGITAKEGDVLVIGGTFYNDNLAVKYVIEESTLIYNGTAWTVSSDSEQPEQPEQPVECTPYEIGKLVYNTTIEGKGIHLDRADGKAFEKTDGTWTEKLTFLEDSGVGVTLNGEPIPMNDIKIPGNIYLGMEGITVEKGAELVIGGTFYNNTLGVMYVIEESKLIYNGTAWTVEMQTYELGALVFHNNSAFGAAKDFNNALYLQRADGQALPVQIWNHLFSYDSGVGFKVNGVEATLSAFQSTPDGLYLAFDALNAWDVVSIGGTYVCETQGATYIIEESKFVWNGNGWEKYAEYTTYEIGKVTFAGVEGAGINLMKVSGEAFEATDKEWYEKLSFYAGSGEGVTLNGEPIAMDDIKIPNDIYLGLDGVEIKEFDELVIEGTFYNPTLGVKYVIEKSTLVFDGETWVDLFPTEKAEAKAELETYLNETYPRENYYDAGWEEMTAIVEAAKVAIDGADRNAKIEEAIATAKAAMAEVKDKEAMEAILSVLRASVKAELAEYKSEADYKAAEWATIQGILTETSTKLDAAQTETAIRELAAEAKLAMDAVLTASQMDEEALKTWRTEAKAAIRAYYEGLNLDGYTAEEQTALNELIATANTAVGEATTKEQIDEIVATFKANVDAVGKTEDNAGDSSDEAKGGCGAVVGSTCAMGAIGLVAAATVVLRKKKENE